MNSVKSSKSGMSSKSSKSAAASSAKSGSIASSHSSYSDDDESSSMVTASVDSAQLRMVREHLEKNNVGLLVNKPQPQPTPSTAAAQSATSWLRRINIFGKSTVAISPEDASKDEEDAEEELTVLSPEEFENLSVADKRTYLELLELRGLPKPDRHLYWEKRTDMYTCYPLPEHPSKLHDDDSSYSDSSYSSYSSYSTANTSAPELQVAKRKMARVTITNLNETREIQLLKHIQAQKRKKFLQDSIVSAHGVRMLPTYLKRPNSPPPFKTIVEQANEEQELYPEVEKRVAFKIISAGLHVGNDDVGSLSTTTSASASLPGRGKRDYLDDEDYSLE